MAYYKIEGDTVKRGNKPHGNGWVEYDPSNKPQELIDAEALEINLELNEHAVQHNGNYFSKGYLNKLTSIHTILDTPADTFIVKDYYNNDVTVNKIDIRNIIELILNS